MASHLFRRRSHPANPLGVAIPRPAAFGPSYVLCSRPRPGREPPIRIRERRARILATWISSVFGFLVFCLRLSSLGATAGELVAVWLHSRGCQAPGSANWREFIRPAGHLESCA